MCSIVKVRRKNGTEKREQKANNKIYLTTKGNNVVHKKETNKQ